MVELFNEGEQEILRETLSFTNEGVDIIPKETTKIVARPEFKNVDLVLFTLEGDK